MVLGQGRLPCILCAAFGPHLTSGRARAGAGGERSHTTWSQDEAPQPPKTPGIKAPRPRSPEEWQGMGSSCTQRSIMDREILWRQTTLRLSGTQLSSSSSV